MITTSDGLKLHVQEWSIPEPKATVVLVHGFAEHIGRYVHVAEALNRAGYHVVGCDHRLHGKSEGTPRAYVTDVDVLVRDLKQVWDNVKTDNPMFMLGHSMGGLIATCFALRYQEEMRGLVTSGAALLSRYSISLLMLSAVQFVARFAPRTPALTLSSSLLSHDPQIVTAYDSDPLVSREPTSAATLAAFAKAGEEALKLAPTLKIPLLMLHGEQDK
ncbi:MAG: lysophospholipase, partial [Anaerolineae bacterium]|nr:lysophospholipase [Anaerolineae bacterium]